MFNNEKLWLMPHKSFEAELEQYRRTMEQPGIEKQIAAFGGPPDKFEPTYKIQDNAAVIQMSGAITTRDSFFARLFGGAVLPVLRREISAADDDRKVQSIVIDISSPGGPVAGVDEFAQFIKTVKKPVVAYSSSFIHSGAYWIASAMDKIVIGQTADVGSVGVIMVLMEYTKMMERQGVEPIVLRSGRYKAIGGPYESLTLENRQILQSEIDYLYEIFATTVAENRSLSVDTVFGMEAGTFIGKQALKIGLADNIGFLDDAIKIANSIVKDPQKLEVLNMSYGSVAELKAAFPELTKSIEETARTEAHVGVEEAIKASTGAVESRVVSLAIAHFGDEKGKVFGELLESGVSVEQYKKIVALNPVVATPEPEVVEPKAEILDALNADTTPAVAAGATPGSGPENLMEAARAIREEKNCSVEQSFKLAKKQFPKLYDKIIARG